MQPFAGYGHDDTSVERDSAMIRLLRLIRTDQSAEGITWETRRTREMSQFTDRERARWPRRLLRAQTRDRGRYG
jgi:hypothetical protein